MNRKFKKFLFKFKIVIFEIFIKMLFLFKGIDEKGVPLKVAEIQGLDNTGMRDAIEKNSK